jgi:CheY-like chemotaxis protein
MSGTPVLAAPEEKAHLLVVEDEPTIRRLFSTLLTAAGYSVAEAENGFVALEEIRRRSPALILSDLNMPRMTGFELLSIIRRRFPEMHVIAMSGAFTGNEVPDGVAADAFYEKSGRNISTLVEVIQALLAERSSTSAASASPTVALWVNRLGDELRGSYILLACPECLRAFPHCTSDEAAMQVEETPCIFCEATIRYALLDSEPSHHPGYAPSTDSPGFDAPPPSSPESDSA